MENKIEEVVNKYIKEIRIIYYGFFPEDEVVGLPDPALLRFSIPGEFLREYVRLNNIKDELPNGLEFLKSTCLLDRLENFEHHYSDGDEEPLKDILEFLNHNDNVDVAYDYKGYLKNSGTIEFTVLEKVRFRKTK